MEKIKSEHRKILDKIRELYIKSGAKSLVDPEVFGLNPYAKSNSGFEIIFDYGTLYRLNTPDGQYVICGSHISSNREKFWKLFNEAFVVEIIEPQKTAKEAEFDLSGPVVRVTER